MDMVGHKLGGSQSVCDNCGKPDNVMAAIGARPNLAYCCLKCCEKAARQIRKIKSGKLPATQIPPRNNQ